MYQTVGNVYLNRKGLEPNSNIVQLVHQKNDTVWRDEGHLLPEIIYLPTSRFVLAVVATSIKPAADGGCFL